MYFSMAQSEVKKIAYDVSLDASPFLADDDVNGHRIDIQSMVKTTFSSFLTPKRI